jgi:hypothetical protein
MREFFSSDPRGQYMADTNPKNIRKDAYDIEVVDSERKVGYCRWILHSEFSQGHRA